MVTQLQNGIGAQQRVGPRLFGDKWPGAITLVTQSLRVLHTQPLGNQQVATTACNQPWTFHGKTNRIQFIRVKVKLHIKTF